MWSIVLVLCLLLVGAGIAVLLVATRPSARPDVIDGEMLVADEADEVLVAPTSAPTQPAGQPLSSVIDD